MGIVDFSQVSEGAIRLGFFLGILSIMAVLEFVIPKRPLRHRKAKRWLTNISIVVIDSLVIRLLASFIVPLAAMATAVWAQNNGWGLFNLLDWPLWLEVLAAIILLDIAIYLQHVMSHKLPVLWMFHKVHHADVDMDVTTGIRFHPIEIALSMLYKILLVLLLGPATFAVFVFEVLINACALFNHANIALPQWLEARIRIILVTPDMHRIHHSVIKRETDSNYGFSVSLWDHVFGTYNDQPELGHERMTIGISDYQNEKPAALIWSLMLPFSKPQPKTGNRDDLKSKRSVDEAGL